MSNRFGVTRLGKGCRKSRRHSSTTAPKNHFEKTKNKHVASKNDKSNNTALYLGGAAIPAVGVLCYLFGSKSRSSRRAPSRQIPNVPTPQSPRKQAPTRPSEPVPQAPRMPEPQEAVTDRIVLPDYVNDSIACSTPIPIRNIAWWGHRCWFHSSILLYYHSNYHDAILNFPIEEARRLLTLDNLNALQRSALEAMIFLAEIFIILKGDESSPYYHNPQVVFLNHKHEDDLLVKLKNFDTINGTSDNIRQSVAPAFATLDPETKPQDACSAVIKDLIPVVHKLMPEWIVPQGPPTGSQLRHNGAHFWVDYMCGNVIFGIGRSSTPVYSVIDTRP